MRRSLIAFLLLVALALAGVAFSEIVFIYENTPEPTDMPAETPTPPAETSLAEPVEILITAAGDVTFGGNMKKNPTSNFYTKAVAAHEGDLSFFFANVYDIFAGDDLTIVNFEGTLTENTRRDKDNEFHFRAPPEHVAALTLSSIEAVSFENNHVMDFGSQGYQDTIAMFNQAGIAYATQTHVGEYTVRGVSIAMLAYQTINDSGAYPRLFEQVPLDVAAARETHDIVIVSYHWGKELDFTPNDNQVKLGRLTIDAGADLVLGHHSHRINPIEYYEGKYIVYSLGNCSFSGNTQPNNMDTFLFQQKFIVEGDTVTSGAFRIIPASISSVTGESGKVSGTNDLIVTPFPEGSKGIDRVIERMIKEGASLTYGLKAYPTSFSE